MPNLENLAKWYQDLMTTTAVRGKGALHYREVEGADANVDKFCCLGIACEVAIKNGLTIPVRESRTYNSNDTKVIEFQYGAGAYNGILPPEVIEWYGLNEMAVYSDNPWLDITGTSVTGYNGERSIAAAHLNDHNGFTFPMIAAAILRTWPDIAQYLTDNDN